MLTIIDKNKQTDLLNKLLNRSQFSDIELSNQVEKIVNQVKEKKDEALKIYTKKFDLVDLDTFLVSEEEIRQAMENIDQDLLDDLKKASNNIRIYHEKQGYNSFELKEENDIIIKQIVKPIERVGIYVPGGTAAYPSTVLMNAIPAKIAGVKKLVMVTPPNQYGQIKPSILVAAKLSGVDQIYKLGGAQAIAALAYGTESIPRVDLIVGPGNIYVALAKKMVSGYVGIDMIAGPTEILIIADQYANPEYVASDLLSQAEHDPLASSILITTSLNLAKQVNQAIFSQLKTLNRIDIINKSLTNYGAIIIVDTLDEGVEISNLIAPEHLEILTENPFDLASKIENAGSIFIGAYTPEPVGDYLAGPNHTLPTSGTSRFSSPLSTHTFQKKTSVVYYSEKALLNAKDSIVRLANEEGLDAHANAINMRFK
jgi:histidinol dehydrogenase